jgi:uncharacterized integral membrane protein
VSTQQPPGAPDRQSPTPSAPTETPAPAQPTATQPAPAQPAVAKKDQPSTWQPSLYLKLGLLLFAIAWVIAFVVENSKQINVHFVFATANVHLIWMILLLLAVGLIGGVLLSQLYRHRRRAQLAKKGRQAGNARDAVRRRDEAEGKSR